MEGATKFIKDNCLQLFFNYEDAEVFRSILKELNQSFVIEHREEEDDGLTHKGNEKGIMFWVHCPTTSFAMCYFQIGKQAYDKIHSKRIVK